MGIRMGAEHPDSPMSSKPLFIFDMANNHMGDPAHGLRIVRELREACAGFDFRFAVKLQYRDLPELIHPDFRGRSDLRFVKRFTETSLGWDDYRRLKDAIVGHGFLSACTPFDEASVEKVEEHGFDFLKVGSCSLTDWPLAERIAVTRLPLIVSTGGESFEDIDRVVSFYQHRNRSISLMHCVAEYPTETAHLQLNQIDMLRRRYSGVEVGYSTHEDPEEMDGVKMALSKGATLFERHVGVATNRYALNAYSSTPAQIRRWLEAARKTMQMAGSGEGRHKFTEVELSTLGELRRGVFARRPIAAGSVIGPGDVCLAMPASPGQLVANELSKYTEYKATRGYSANEAILHSGVVARDTRSAVHGIVKDVKALLRASGVAVPTQLELEISHHYGIDRFREVGSAMITVINREYCKRMVLMLPGQRHPEHWHTQKDETFHMLHGEIDLVLEGVRRHCVRNDVIVIPRGAKHEFGSATGAVIEEISSTHVSDDSGYSDTAIGPKDGRKTYVTNWMD
jgi:sialic acid synthase SpsE/quercetin dioxygenase-like cupin family protein